MPDSDALDLRTRMSLYREGFGPLPKEYIEMHTAAARRTLPELCTKQGLRLITTELVCDGWFDGMKSLRAVCEDSAGRLRDMRWHDSNGGSWFEKPVDGGGEALVWVPDDRPGFI